MNSYGSRKENVEREQRWLEDRQREIDRIHQMYARFGDDVVQIVMLYALRPKGMAQLGQRLRIYISEYDERLAHENLLRYIQEKGAARFLFCARSGEPDRTDQIGAGMCAGSAIAAEPSGPAAFAQAVDRRSGRDRRLQKDRRKDVDAITKNKRFGGERRQNRERRQRQQPPPWPT
ncbi:MAG: hypothetical protein BWZ10_00483 [candidate division BRC1 bacterium ADurb.BinA364]|nr:MAG: hypothetical protein BWZ10_00483 [candidate division BRC1 bacterium ADurb.BinA364]